MNRRSFFPALAAILAAPRIIAALAPRVGQLPTMSLHGLSTSTLPNWEPTSCTLAEAYRKMQGPLMEGFHRLGSGWDSFETPNAAHRLRWPRDSFSAWERRVIG